MLVNFPRYSFAGFNILTLVKRVLNGIVHPNNDYRPSAFIRDWTQRATLVCYSNSVWCETNSQATTPFGYCPSTAFQPVRPHCANARRNRCQEYHNRFPLENWRRPLGRPRTMWIKTIQLANLKSNNLSLNKATDVAQNRPFWRLMSI